jgi:hypothetical protein
VGLDGVAAREREAERTGGIQRYAGKPLVKWIHAGTRPCLRGESKAGETILPASPEASRQEQPVPDLAENLFVEVRAQVIGADRLPDNALVHDIPLGWILKVEHGSF